MGDGKAPARRKLTVTKCDYGRSGNTNGKDWTMYDVACRDEAGQPVDLQFNSFESLPVGELVDYEVTYRDHERYGRTYTLKRPGGGGGSGGLGRSVDDLRGRVERLEGQVTSIINGAQPIGDAGGASGSAPPAGAPPAAPATPPAAPPGGSADDDIPF